MTFRTVALICLAGLLALAPRGTLEGQSVLHVRAGGPLHRLLLVPPPDTAEPLPGGGIGVQVALDFANVFLHDSTEVHELYMDLERLTTVVTLAVGLGRGVEVGGAVALERTGGGFMDRPLEWWHQRLGVSDENRDRFGPGRYGQELLGPDRAPLLAIPARSMGPDHLGLHLLKRMAGGERWHLAARGDVRVPLARPTTGTLRSEAGMSLLGGGRTGSWGIHGQASVATLRSFPELGEGRAPGLWTLSAGASRPLTGGIEGVVQYTWSSGILRGFGARTLEGSVGKIALGAQGRSGEWGWELSFQEDVPPGGPAADFAVTAAVSRVW